MNALHCLSIDAARTSATERHHALISNLLSHGTLVSAPLHHRPNPIADLRHTLPTLQSSSHEVFARLVRRPRLDVVASDTEADSSSASVESSSSSNDDSRRLM